MGAQMSGTQPINTMEHVFIQDTVGKNCVTVFSKTTCIYCAKVKKLFSENNIEYEAVELNERNDGEKLMDTLFQVTGSRTVPRVFVNGHCIGGAAETLELYKDNKLFEMINECKG